MAENTVVTCLVLEKRFVQHIGESDVAAKPEALQEGMLEKVGEEDAALEQVVGSAVDQQVIMFRLVMLMVLELTAVQEQGARPWNPTLE